MFAVGTLYAAKDFLELTFEAELTSELFKLSFKSFKYSNPEKILQIVFKCGWALVTEGGTITLSDKGQEIASKTYQTGLLLQLEDLIANYNPEWASLLPKGRAYAKNYLPPDAKQCFKEAGLFEDLTDEIIKYWDKLAIAYRNYSNQRKLEVGRRGERLTCIYELERTGIKPRWQSIESNLDGFDILSIIDNQSRESLSIEVKATTSKIRYAKFHVTRREWDTANNTAHYLFHLWHISETPLLKVVELEKITPHIPIDNGEGLWESVEIPYKLFFS